MDDFYHILRWNSSNVIFFLLLFSCNKNKNWWLWWKYSYFSIINYEKKLNFALLSGLEYDNFFLRSVVKRWRSKSPTKRESEPLSSASLKNFFIICENFLSFFLFSFFSFFSGSPPTRCFAMEIKFQFFMQFFHLPPII